MLYCLLARAAENADPRTLYTSFLKILPSEDPVPKGELDETRDFAGKSSVPQKGFIMVYNRWRVRTNNAVICGLCSKRTMVFIIAPY